MATAQLTFDLNDPQDEIAHLRALKSLDMALTLWDIDQYLRGQVKYGQLDDNVRKALDTTRDTLRQLMNNRNIDLDELIQ